MTQVHEFSTWQLSGEWQTKNAQAIANGKAYKGTKWTVAIGEMGTRTFLVLGATSKDQAKEIAKAEMASIPGITKQSQSKIVARDVTASKKYN